MYEAAFALQPGLVDEHDAVSEVLGPENRGETCHVLLTDSRNVATETKHFNNDNANVAT